MSARVPRALGAHLAAASAALALLAGCTFGEPAQEGDQTGPDLPTPTEQAAAAELTDVREVVAAGLDVPWGIDFLPDGAALVTERDRGRILRVGPERAGDRLVVADVQTIEGVDDAGEGGLLGLTVSPDYEQDGHVFVYYTTEEDNRIARLTPGEEPEPILTGIPRASNHNGGQLAFGPDGYLYATTGDAEEPARSQDEADLAGSILRLTPEGEPASDNPFDGSPVYAYGLRNPQGLAWDEGGRLWATDFGADEWDEVNLIEPGGNYGWPEVEGIGNDPRFVDPQVVWQPVEASCSGAAVVGDTLVVACLRGQRLWTMELTGSGTVLGAPQPWLVEEYGRLRAVTVAPDGAIWAMTSNLDGRLPGDPHPDDDRIVRMVVAGTDGAGQL